MPLASGSHSRARDCSVYAEIDSRHMSGNHADNLKRHKTMQAIITRYLGATNTRGSRIKASARAGSITLGWDDSMSPEANHKRAALALASRFKWNYGPWHGAALLDGPLVWVCADTRDVDYCFEVQS